MTVIGMKQPDTGDYILGTREPPPPRDVTFGPLLSVIFNDEEFYMMVVNNTEILRKKIGSWVNITKLISLVEGSTRTALEKEVEKMNNVYYLNVQGRLGARFRGWWTTLDNARTFARKYNIEKLMGRILDFERIALVKYMGVEFYEFFAHVTVDINIRILREKNTARINMWQLFVVYNKIKGPRANPFVTRNFHNNAKDIVIRGDKTLCGGIWALPPDAKKFAQCHGFLKHVKVIVEFSGGPEQSHIFPMDVFERTARNHWIATVSDDSFYGFPISFKGGLAPAFPQKRRGKSRTEFSADDLVITKNMHIELTKEGQTTRHSINIVRRLSDGWVNATSIVQICVLIRLSDLDLRKDDPDLATENEMYYRDVLERYVYETVITPKVRRLCGKWISAADGKALLHDLRVMGKKWGVTLKEFMNDPSLKSVSNDDEDSDHGDSDEDELELIPENDFLQQRHIAQQQPSFRDRKYFDEEPPSDEEPFILHGVTDDEEDEVVEVDGDSNSEADGETPEPVVFKRPHNLSDVRRATVRSVLSSSGGESEDAQPVKRFKGGDSEASNTTAASQINQLFVGDESDDEVNESKSKGVDLGDSSKAVPEATDSTTPVRDAKTKAPSLEEVTRRLKSIVAELDELLSDPRTVFKAKSQKEIRKWFQELRMFNALTPEIKSRTKLSNLFRTLGSLMNVFQKDIGKLEERWAYECQFSVASITPADEPPRPWPRPEDKQTSRLPQVAPMPAQYGQQRPLNNGIQGPPSSSLHRIGPQQSYQGTQNSTDSQNVSQNGYTPQYFGYLPPVDMRGATQNNTNQGPPLTAPTVPIALIAPHMNSQWQRGSHLPNNQWQQNGPPNMNNMGYGRLPQGPSSQGFRGGPPPQQLQQKPFMQPPPPPQQQQQQQQLQHQHYPSAYQQYQQVQQYVPYPPQREMLFQQRQPPPSQQNFNAGHTQNLSQNQGYRGNKSSNYMTPNGPLPQTHRGNRSPSISQGNYSIPSKPQWDHYEPAHDNHKSLPDHASPSNRYRERPAASTRDRGDRGDRGGVTQDDNRRDRLDHRRVVSSQKPPIRRSVQQDSPSNQETPKPTRPLSPPTNYCAETDQIEHDSNEFALKDAEEHILEEKKLGDYTDCLDNPEMDKYKRTVHFEIGTQQDLLWRRDVIFGDNGDNVSLTRKIFAMMKEAHERGLRHATSQAAL
ncbi:hypothetical protein BON22_3895 [Cyberlindnera fabianii]|uniref:HTH APSES-type domain-containing protein n=1 Tax=Cyberlindnera fabianii TaxID=36022 RepID=A0A1V2L2M8_CYBFA|nr:hypothetical protein BON22_3895 [Cyberlindnera fabianii]